MEPVIRETVAWAVGGSGVDFLVGMDDGLASLSLTNTVAEIGYKLVKCLDLCLSGQVAVKVTDQTDAKGYIIQIVACHMSSVKLSRPAVSDLNLSVAGTMAVPDHKMIGQAVYHVTDSAVVNIEHPGISFSCAAVVDDDIFPPSPPDRCMVDGVSCGGAEVVVSAMGAEEPAPAMADGGRGGGSGLKPDGRIYARLFNRDGSRWIRAVWQWERWGSAFRRVCGIGFG